MFLADHGHRAIAHDRRGHGRSSQTWHGNEMDTYADDLACLMDTLDLQEATLVGHSTGGGEVVHYIGRHGTGRVAQAGPGLRRPAADAAHRRQPRGLPIETFDEIRAGKPRTARSSTATSPTALLRAQPQRRRAQGVRDAFWLQSMACGHRAPTSASRRSRPPTSAPTWRSSTSPPWSSTATTTRSCRSRSAARSAELVDGRPAQGLRGRRARAARHRPRPAARRPARLHQLLTPERNRIMNRHHAPTPSSWSTDSG